MDYLLSFLEGIITFISPCLLPMLPVYLTFFAGQDPTTQKKRTVTNVLGFILGFTLVFTLLGVFAGTAGSFVRRYSSAVDLAAGFIIILFGLNFTGLLKLKFLNQSRALGYRPGQIGFFRSILFGMAFSIGWTPCVGAFLGSALMLAASGGESLKGFLMLLAYSAGLAVPFLFTALLIDRMKSSLDFIKRHYRTVNIISGGFLIAVGILLATGLLGRLLRAF
jgi:cytochrome c-type biogenesis protein